jgi:hypothetical protein
MFNLTMHMRDWATLFPCNPSAVHYALQSELVDSFRGSTNEIKKNPLQNGLKKAAWVMMIILFYGPSPGSIKQRPAAALAGGNQVHTFTRKQ